MSLARFASAAAVLALLAAPAVAAGVPIAVAKIGNHQILTDASGRTLYTFDKDSKGKSTCYGLCSFAWPAAKAAANATPSGQFTVVPRTNGGGIWAYKGAPLYRYFKDHKPGDMFGNGVEGIWHTAIK